MDIQIDIWMDVRMDENSLLLDIVPFGVAAQKGNKSSTSSFI